MDLVFDAPGPGSWSLDRSHYAGGTTPISQWLIRESMPTGMERVFSEIGAPVRRIDAAFVHGFMYTRVRPLVGADRTTTKLPPTPLLKIVSYLHPEFRRRAKRAARTLRDKPHRDVVRRWEEEIRPQLYATNRKFQDVDLAALSDGALQAHVTQLLDHCRESYELHFWLHGHDLGPVARLVHEIETWGLDPREATAALVGASPSTTRPANKLVRLRRAVEDTGVDASTLDDVRSCSPEAARLLDEYLAERGAVLATGYDLDSFTLSELPGAIVASIRTASVPTDHDDQVIAAQLRSKVPESHRQQFDDYLSDARIVMDMRDDNGPLTAEWPVGLLRLALLEAGRRLTVRSALLDPDHALELTADEARRMLNGGIPDAETIDQRAAERREQTDLDPPATLGPDEPQPPLDVLPKPLPTLVGIVQTALRHMGMGGVAGADALIGVGIGTESYTGRARIATSADEAVELLEPGDVLVVRATSPAFNVVLTIAGAIVTTSGGALSHAAVLARELGIPAVVGASGALTKISDGATIEVDPVAGRVVVVGEPVS